MMDMEKQVLENKAKLREMEIRFDALVNLLENEGIVIRDEVEQEFAKLVKKR